MIQVLKNSVLAKQYQYMLDFIQQEQSLYKDKQLDEILFFKALAYKNLNKYSEIVCERFFLPYGDIPLLSIESKRPLKDFDLLLVSVSFETDFINILKILKKGNIPLFSEERKEIVLAGGVAQNTRLQNMIAGMAQHYGWKWRTAPSQFNRDNGAMIAFCGFLNKHNATKNIETLKVKPYFRFEELQDVVMVDNR